MNLPPLNKLRIVNYPDPVLKKRAEEVTAFDADLQALAERMIHLMREAPGVGLAAPQVGVSIRLFVFNATGEDGDSVICVNPKLSDLEDAEDGEEGCLSLPEVTVTMRRAVRATLTACDATGKSFTQSAEGLIARIWQHEDDHLNGRLIIDRMSDVDEIANRRVLKQLQQDYARRKK